MYNVSKNLKKIKANLREKASLSGTILGYLHMSNVQLYYKPELGEFFPRPKLRNSFSSLLEDHRVCLDRIAITTLTH